MRKTLGVCLLALLLTGPTAAGEMPNGTPAPPPPPPQPASAVQKPTDAAKDPAAQDTSEAGMEDILTQIVLTVLLSVFS